MKSSRNLQPKGRLAGCGQTEAAQADAKAATKVCVLRVGVGGRGWAGRGAAWGVPYGESTPSGGMPSGNPVAVAFMNFTKAITSGEEDQTVDAVSSDGTT